MESKGNIQKKCHANSMKFLEAEKDALYQSTHVLVTESRGLISQWCAVKVG